MLRYAACERNKDAILNVLKQHLPSEGAQMFLEVASGSGEHVTHFATHFTNITFQPTDIELELLSSIDAHSTYACVSNVRPATMFDVTRPMESQPLGDIKIGDVDVVYNSNMIHISSNAAVDGLFKVAGKLLRSNGLLICYGPFGVDGKISPESNVQFDRSLRARNTEWGLRDVNFLQELAEKNFMKLLKMYDMPANNKVLVFWKC